MSGSLWTQLGITATTDRDAIRRAYAKQLRATNPEDDPQGFQALRAAYEEALARAAHHAARQMVPEPEAAPEAAPTPAPQPEPPPAPEPDPELDDLDARWTALMAGFAPDGRPDPAALAALLAAPALDRIALRAQVEGHVAHLIASNLPRADALVAPAIAGFGWGHTHSADVRDPAVARILARDVELHPSEIGLLRPARDEAEVPARKPLFGGKLWMVFGLIFLIRVVAIIADDRPSSPPPVPKGQPVSREIAPAIAPERWFDGQAVPGSQRPPEEVLVLADLLIRPDGTVASCEENGAKFPELSMKSCAIIKARGRFRPAAAPLGDLRRARIVVTWQQRPPALSTYVPAYNAQMTEVALLALSAQPSPRRGRLAPPPVADLAPDPMRRGPECPADPPRKAAREPQPCSPSARWLSVADFPEELLTGAGSRELTLAFDIGRDGFVENCRLTKGSGVAAVDLQVCRLIARRVHFLPGRQADGRAVGYSYSFSWGWSVSTVEKARPPPAELPSDPPPQAG